MRSSLSPDQQSIAWITGKLPVDILMPSDKHRGVMFVRRVVAVVLAMGAAFLSFYLALAILWSFSSDGDRWQPISRGLLCLIIMAALVVLARVTWPSPERSTAR